MKISTLLSLLFVAIISGNCVFAQLGIISTIAGNGVGGFSGDGAAATAAQINHPYAVAIDGSGNIYIADENNNCIRKINSSGVISTIAGNGTLGYSGDGGAATAAELSLPRGVAVDGLGNVYIADYGNCMIRKVDNSGIISAIAGYRVSGSFGDGGPATASGLYFPTGVAIDRVGNVYIADLGNYAIRKINTSGIISTFAGNGHNGFSGDGGAATAARIYDATGVAVDGIGNVYIADNGNNRIRKVNSIGIITTFAGSGMAGLGSYVGDGGAATLAYLNHPNSVEVDESGNVYIADSYNHRIRKINRSGIITTVAGNGTAGYSGDGIDATASELNYPFDVTIDWSGNAYITDEGNSRIRKVALGIPSSVADSFSVFIDNTCTGFNFSLNTNNFSTGQHIKTYFGNGHYLDTIVSTYGSIGIANFSEQYSASGTYTIKHVLYDGAIAVDSISYSYYLSLCQNLNIRFYLDANGNCIKDSTESYFNQNTLTEIDSNGVPVDTVSSTSGFSYLAYGNTGDIYSFRVLSTVAGTHISCPSTAIIYDTLVFGTQTTKYFAVNCDTGTNFDLWVNSSNRTGMHIQDYNFISGNSFCTPESSVLTFNFSPLFNFVEAYPTPTSVIGNTINWDISSLSYVNSPQLMSVHLEVSGTLLIPGDTVMSNGAITPTIGDYDSTNNYINRIDTVRSSYDPNEMAVLPGGCFPEGTSTNLQYTISFENTGNDTAHNIYVMDTLSDYVNSHSLRIVAASHTMNTSRWYDTSIHHNIVKFDFAGINLLDSSHFGHCDGTVIFSINTIASTASGTNIFNHAGIFFDDNPVVMTNYVENTVGCLTTKITQPITTTKTELYPNPATDELIIKTDSKAYTSFTITNIMGQQLMEQNILSATSKVNIGALPAGVYYVTFRREGGGELVKKLVKMK